MTTRSDQTARVAAVLAALREKSESDAEPGWRDVYLDNARPPGMDDKQFRAALASLARRGQYRPIDGFAFGSVKMVHDAKG